MVNGSFPDAFYDSEIVSFPIAFLSSPLICVLGISYYTSTYAGYRCPTTMNPHDNQNTRENWTNATVELGYSYYEHDWQYMINYQLFLGV